MAVALLNLKSNGEFLDLYHPYIKTEWRRHYFFYDHLKAEYKALKEQKSPNLQKFEEDFLAEIKRVDWFLKITLDDIAQDLRMISEAKEPLQKQKSSIQKQQTEHTIEVVIRGIFDKCKACEQFYQLNHFVVCKIAKKFEKLIESTHKSRKKKEADFGDDEQKLDFVPWTEYRSNEFFQKDFARRSVRIVKLKQDCIFLYSDFFRQKYPSLAFGELEFMKNKDREHKRTRTIFGIKLGLIIALICWVVFDSLLTSSRFDFWVQPGLYVYTTVGNLLLFRLLWSLNIFVWARYDINYIPLLSLENLKPNLLAVSNSTATQFVLYSLNLVIFFEANSVSTPILSRTPLRYICPFLLLVWSVCFEAYEYVFRFNGLVTKYSRGLFSRAVFIRCFMAPFTAVRFRDVFAADVLTSFTKVISDTLYASCWILSGQFLVPPDENYNKYGHTVFGSNALVCSSSRMVIAVAVAVCIPLWIRFLQCLRQMRDSKWQIWPFMFNALKYALSIAVVIYGTKTSVHAIDPTYMNLVIITTIYKWWWDVVMDWGLFEVMPTIIDFKSCVKRVSVERRRRRSTFNNMATATSAAHAVGVAPRRAAVTATSSRRRGGHREEPHLFLRPLLMYPSHYVYYAAIVLDLILRFMWVASLVPKELFGSFVGPQLSFFLGSMEIVRRAMWGFFRLEYEHLKNVQKGAAGFLKYRRTSYDFSRRQELESVKGAGASSAASPGGADNSESGETASSPLFDSRYRRGYSVVELSTLLHASHREDEQTSMLTKSEASGKRPGGANGASSSAPSLPYSMDPDYPAYEELPSCPLGYDVEDGADNEIAPLVDDDGDALVPEQRDDEEGATDNDDNHPPLFLHNPNGDRDDEDHSDDDDSSSDTDRGRRTRSSPSRRSKPGKSKKASGTSGAAQQSPLATDFTTQTMVAIQAMMDRSHGSASRSSLLHDDDDDDVHDVESGAFAGRSVQRSKSNVRKLLAIKSDDEQEGDDNRVRSFTTPRQPSSLHVPSVSEDVHRLRSLSSASSADSPPPHHATHHLHHSSDSDDHHHGPVGRRKDSIGSSTGATSVAAATSSRYNAATNGGLRARQPVSSTPPRTGLSRQNTNTGAPFHLADVEDP